jgi:hypothetical protein
VDARSFVSATNWPTKTPLCRDGSSFDERSVWPISSGELNCLIDLGLLDNQIAKYFAVEQEKVSALRTHYRLAERYGPHSPSADDDSVGEQVSEKLPSHALLKRTIEPPHRGLPDRPAATIGELMSEKMPLITSVKRRVPGPVTKDGSAIVVCEVETVDGSMFLQLTPKAANELNALLDKLSTRVTPVVSIKLFE